MFIRVLASFGCCKAERSLNVRAVASTLSSLVCFVTCWLAIHMPNAIDVLIP